ncbi:MAG TPA: DUF1236 domain-containing protein [Xanthobacteraceae bacterium]|jgi:hypothetical protein|nr:DUF1236 domain-containing protein [Xanthobacteraceae bacterium]
MRNKLLATAAVAALICGTSLALAQTPGGTEGNKAGTAQAPGGTMSPGGATHAQPAPGGTMGHTQTTPGGSAQMAPTGQPPARAEETHPGNTGPSGTQQRTGQTQPSGTEQRTGQTQQNGSHDQTGQMQPNGGPSRDNAAQNKTTGSSHAAQLTDDQRVKIKGVIGSEHNVARVNNVNFDISVGTAVPRSVQFAVLPAEIVTIVPEYSGFDYIVVGDQLLIIDPNTLEIVAILPA